MVYSVRVDGTAETAAALRAAGVAAVQGNAELADQWGRRMAAAVRGRASGRPGPNIITGRYIASITYRVTGSGSSASAEVYSDAPQSARLELGFYGTDSLGRRYTQPPYPHFYPAYAEQWPYYVRDQAALAARVAAVGNSGGTGGGGGFLRRVVGGLFRR